MDLISQLKFLWPDFYAVVRGEPEGLIALFVLVIFLIFGLSLVCVCVHYYRSHKRIGLLASLIHGQSKDNLAFDRRKTLESAMARDSEKVGLLWREFDESLVLSGDGKQLFNTLDADHFFNAHTLASGLTGSRLLAAAPSFLIALGVLGTFVGLTIGLTSLNLDSRSDVDTLRDGIDGLIQGAAVAFMSSVWGVLASLALNVIEKLLERSALHRISIIQHQIDFLYPRIPAEQSLVTISDHTRKSTEALQELHERIGDRLQEAMQGMTDSMQEALANTLNNIMKPAIESLVSHSTEQSTVALEGLVNRFMEGATEAGQRQNALMEQASERINASVERISQQFNDVTSHMEEQRVMQEKANQQNAEDFEQQMTRMMETSNRSQEAMEHRFGDLLQGLSDHSRFTQEALDQRDSARSEALDGHLQSISSGQQELLAGIADSVTETRNQSEQLVRQHTDLMAELSRATDAMSASSQHLDSSANQLGLLGSNIEQTTRLLGERLQELTVRLRETSEQNGLIATQITEQSAEMTRLQQSITEAVGEYREAARLTSEGIRQMEGQQKDWLAGIHEEFTRLGDGLSDQVTRVEKQAADWLSEYGNQVSQQVRDRMNDWNTQSLRYAEEMSRIAESLSETLDELGVRER